MRGFPEDVSADILFLHSPDGDTILGRYIHAVTWADVIGLLEFRELGDTYVDTEVIHGVRVKTKASVNHRYGATEAIDFLIFS